MTWNQFPLTPLYAAEPASSIAAVSRMPGHMEIWWIAEDGSVNGAYWYRGSDWQPYPLAQPGSAAFFGGLAAVSRIPSSMELWYIGPDGSINDANWSPTAGGTRSSSPGTPPPKVRSLRCHGCRAPWKCGGSGTTDLSTTTTGTPTVLRATSGSHSGCQGRLAEEEPWPPFRGIRPPWSCGRSKGQADRSTITTGTMNQLSSSGFTLVRRRRCFP